MRARARARREGEAPPQEEGEEEETTAAAGDLLLLFHAAAGQAPPPAVIPALPLLARPEEEEEEGKTAREGVRLPAWPPPRQARGFLEPALRSPRPGRCLLHVLLALSPAAA